MSIAMVIRTVEPRRRDGPVQPPDEALMPHVHPQGDLRLPPVAAEVSLAEEDTYDHSLLVGGQVEPGHAVSVAFEPPLCVSPG